YKGSILREAGIAFSKIGDQQQSINYLQRALEWEAANGDNETYAQIAINLANSFNQNGEAGKAVNMVQQTLKRPGITAERRAYLYAVLAEVANQQGNTEQALQYAKTALPLLQQLPEEAAQKYFRLSLIYKVLGNVMAARNNTREARAAYRQSLAVAQQYNPELLGRAEAKTFIALGALYRETAQYDSALYYANRALAAIYGRQSGIGLSRLPTEAQLLHENSIMEALDAAAETYLNKFAIEKNITLLQQALQCTQLAFKVEERLRQLYIYDKSKYVQGNESRNRSERGIKTCRLLWETTNAPRWLEEAFLFAEQSRANALLDKIKENLLFATGNDSSVTAARYTWYRINELDDRIKSLPADSASQELLNRLNNEKALLEEGFAQNRNRVNQLLQNTEQHRREAIASIKNIRKKLLGSNSGLVAFFAGDSVLYRFSMNTREPGITLTTLPLHTTDSLVRALLPYFTEPTAYLNNPAGYAAMADSLGNLLVPQFGLLPAGTERHKLLIVPDGILSFLPFEALNHTPRPGDFLLNRYRFSYAFSCTSLLQQMELPEEAYRYEALAVAPFVQQGFRGLPALPGSAKEMNALQQMGENVQVYEHKDALAGTFMYNAGQAGIVHIASHAFAGTSDTVSPRIEFADSSISLEKIYALRLHNRLVVLSACKTGIGELVAAEGALSLARGFYYAGAKNVVNSLWATDDESAGAIFTSFYKHVRATGSIDLALSLARREYLNHTPPEKHSPYYWAALVCIGDGVLKQQPATGISPYAIAGIFGAMGLVILAWQKRGKKNAAQRTEP
ncbi:MAG: CHAT domain-containing protein, partial [Dinghuibacter sp.]|nr:CHAT domain-containing protein [Dinghuibacter sp.]